MSDFSTPHPVQFKGNRLARLALRLMGWRYEFEGFAARQGVAIVYPHTSNWDAPLMFLVKWACGVDVKFWGKASLFNIPLFGAWLRWIGGVPVQRTTAQGITAQMVQIIQTHQAKDEYFWLALAPEGTRKYLPGWRSGFYRVATAAQVPLLVVTINYSKRLCCLTEFIKLSGNEAQDMARIAGICSKAQGLKPDRMSPVVLLDAQVDRQTTVVQ